MGKLWSDTISGDELRRIQRGIDQTMRETIAHRPYSPGEMPASETVRVAGAPVVRGTGWQTERELELPVKPGSFLDRVVGGVIDNATLSPREKILRDLRALSPEDREKLKGEIEASKDPRAEELKRL
jgi:hypothetical protein